MSDLSRRGFLTLIGASIAAPAIAKTAGGVMLPVPQQVIGNRLVLRDLVVSGIDIIDCRIIGNGGDYGMHIQNCFIENVFGGLNMSNCVVENRGFGIKTIGAASE